MDIKVKRIGEYMSQLAMAKVRISVTLPREIVEWIDRKVKERVYANRSHAIEAIVLEKIRREEG